MVLTLYDPNAPTFLYMDASGVGISAVLSQEQGVERSQSHALATCYSQQKATIALLEQEAVACIWGQRSLSSTCGGRHFTLHTDQHALTFCFQGPAKAEQMQRSCKLVQWLSACQPLTSMSSP